MLTRAALVGALAVSLVATTISPAVAADSTATSSDSTTSALAQLGITVSADGWISYNARHSASLPLSKTAVTTVKGARTPDGLCSISGEIGSASTGNYSEQIAFNPVTCESKVLTGTLSPAAVADLLAQSPRATGGANASQASGASGVSGASGASGGSARAGAIQPLVSYQTAHTTTRWIDPVNIVITSQAINMTWPLYGAGGTLSASAPAYAFPYDGWTTYGPTFTPWHNISGDAGWWIGANSHFVNYDFAAIVYALLGLAGWLACGAHTTTRADFYHYVEVWGYRNNTKSHWWNDSVSGACSNLVHHEALTGFGSW